MDKTLTSIVNRLEFAIRNIDSFATEINNSKDKKLMNPFSFDKDGFITVDTKGEKIAAFTGITDVKNILKEAIQKVKESQKAGLRVTSKLRNEVYTSLVNSSEVVKIINESYEKSKPELSSAVEQTALLNIQSLMGNITALQMLQNTIATQKRNPFYIPHQRLGKHFYDVKLINPKTKQERTLTVESERVQLTDGLPFKEGSGKKRLEARRQQTEKYLRDNNWNFNKDIGEEYVEISEVRDRSIEEVREYLHKEDIPHLERLATALGYEDNQDVQSFLDELLTLSGTAGAGRFLAHRKKDTVTGYINPDNIDNYAANQIRLYIASVANASSTTIWGNAIGKTLDTLGEVNKSAQQYWEEHFRLMKKPENWSGVAKSFSFHMLLGFNVGSAIVNASQTFILTAPTLKGIVGWGGLPSLLVTRTLYKAFTDALLISKIKIATMDSYGFDLSKPVLPEHLEGRITQAEWDTLRRENDGGLIQARTNIELGVAQAEQLQQMHINHPKFASSLSMVLKASAYMFGFIEQINRITASLAARRLASMPGMLEKFQTYASNASFYSAKGDSFSVEDAADMIVIKTHFLIGKENRPQYFQNPVMGVATQFTAFVMNSASMWSQALRMAAGDRWPTKLGKRTTKRMTPSQLSEYKRTGSILIGGYVGTTLMVAGLMGLPGADNLKQMIKLLSKLVNAHGFDLEYGLRHWLLDIGLSPSLVDMSVRGPLSRLTGVDVSKRMSISEILPYDLIFNDLTVATGPTGAIFIDVMKRIKASIEDMNENNIAKPTFRLLSSVLPLGLRNVIDSTITMVDPDEPIRTSTGRTILPTKKLGTLEHMIRLIGFSPHTLRQERLKKQIVNHLEMSKSSKQNYYYSQLAKIIVKKNRLYKEGDMGGYKEALKVQKSIMEDIRENNREAEEEDRPERIITIQNNALRNRILAETFGVASPEALRRTTAKRIRSLITPEKLKALGAGTR